MRVRSGLMALATLACLPVPALAHGYHDGTAQPAWQADLPPQGDPRDGGAQGYDGAGYDREGWLRECRRRLGDNGVGGAVIGGVVGGVAGNVIAGHGDKVLGTVAGAAVGALAGRAIDKGEDAPRVRDRCEAMLEGGQGYAPYGGTYGQSGYGDGYRYAPIMMVPAPQGTPGIAPRKCTETVTTTTEYVDMPRRSRYIPRRAAPDKRVKIVPDKRVPVQ